MSRSLLQVPRLFKRLSGTVADCLGVSYRCPDGHDIVVDCLGVSCRCLDGLGIVTDRLGVSCMCIAGMLDFLKPSQTV
ncbi:hypothetical protein DPMN_054435 [Dreissena polymorpha]|uniref:Uncharacterized protein n=1 Tax=Dreissena polymorpha TaxID=45954 RepID=A0A9D4CN43_DREPO|nr:hypothetical protein DPMN_054435 [Dreissena polymorpha]